jgi:hypothetical protein
VSKSLIESDLYLVKMTKSVPKPNQNKANSAQLKQELWLSLAIIIRDYFLDILGHNPFESKLRLFSIFQNVDLIFHLPKY